MVEAKTITFTLKSPNVKTNPMPTHGGASISVVEEINGKILVKKVEEIQTPIIMIGEQLLKSGFIPVNLLSEDNIGELMGFIQQILDQGTMQIELHNKENEVDVIDIPYDVVSVQIPITPLVIEFLAPFAYEDEKVMSWIY